MDRTLVIATRNKGKIEEFSSLLCESGLHVCGLQEFGPIPAVIEDGDSFEENAVKKARFTARVLGLPALADDSGLTVRAINGMPGIYSARYAGEGAKDEDNNAKLLEALRGKNNREATFICVIAIAVPRGPALIYEGKCDGFITESPAGTNGFGYDPVFYYPPGHRTFAQMSLEEKNKVSHRGKAMAELKEEAAKVIKWLDLRIAEEPI